MGVTVTFVAILELMREGLIDIVQSQPYAPLHVRAASPGRTLHVVTAEGSESGAGEVSGAAAGGELSGGHERDGASDGATEDEETS
jgi:segregation and condensation protein A